jgi:tetratricopeptide (TPR) repeat protein
VLRLCAFYAATPIPLSLLVRGAPLLRQCSARFGGEASALIDDEAELWVRDALVDLKTYSLAQYDGRTCAFHALLQTVERLNIPADTLAADRAAAVELFLTTPPLPGWQDDQRRYWSDAALAEWRPLLGHGRALLSLAGADDPELRSRLGGAMAGLGDWQAALPLCTEAHRLFAARLGDEHLRTLAAWEDLGYLQKYLGHPEASLHIFSDSEGRRRALQGPEHEDTLRTLHNVALAETLLGRFDQAEAHMRAVGEARRRVLGPDHYDSITSIHDLGWMLREANRDAEAQEQCFIKARAAWERTLGPEHPDTISSMNNLALVYRTSGDYEEAERLFTQVLQWHECILGPEHPEALLIVNNLADLIRAKGDYGKAEELSRRALNIQEQVLGLTHRETLMSLDHLIVVLEETGRGDEARRLRLRRIGAISGGRETPPRVLRESAGDAYALGDYRLAETLLQSVLAHHFEIPGTYCHLARIALVNGDATAARDHAAQAWEHRAEAPPYVIPRILWLQLAASLLAGPETGDPGPAPRVLLGRLKTALQADGVQMEWTMDPVLKALKPSVSPEDHALLVALVAALSFADKVAALDDLATWRAAEAQPLE